ncbi:MAG: adenylate/guanylate cyclase domain-containing protein [Pseudomonadota bacterium]
MSLRLLLRFVTTLVIFVPFYLHATGTRHSAVLERLEAASYDARLIMTLPNSRDDRIVIVDIDERTMQEQGQWPWGRDKLARFVDLLFDDYNIGVLGFDAIFPEPDGRSALPILDGLARDELSDDPMFVERLAALRGQFDFDRMFANSLKNRKTVVGFSFNSDESVSPTNNLGPPILTQSQHNSEIRLHEGLSYTASLPMFVEAAAATGFINNQSLDFDGSFRRAPLLQSWNGDWYPSLALAVTGLALDSLDLDLVFFSGEDGARDGLDLEWLTLGSRVIPVDESATVLVPYRDDENSFPVVSATDVFTQEAPPYVFDGAIVLVGTSAIGLRDMRVTPVSENYSGVQVQASVISGILDGRIMHSPRYVQGVEVVTLVLLAVLGTLVMVRLPLVPATLSMLLLATITFAVNLQLWSKANLVVPLASSFGLLFLVFMVHMILSYFGETRGRRQLSARFGEYIPPELVEEMGRNPGDFNMESASKVMTVMFTDIRGFTGISEGLEPRELSQLMNEYLTPMTRVIHRNRGTIDKYMGDAIMAFWGAPLDDEQHAANAIKTALEMQEALSVLGEQFTEKGWPAISIGVGINSGEMRVGDMGSQFRKAYTVMGDAVNLAARLEGLTKHYGVGVAVADQTVQAVPDIQFLELDRVRVKGKDESVAIFTPLAPKAAMTSTQKMRLGQHKNAIRAYRAQNWDSAESAFFQLQQSFPQERVYRIYLDRITHFRREAPPEGWDGVFTHKEK